MSAPRTMRASRRNAGDCRSTRSARRQSCKKDLSVTGAPRQVVCHGSFAPRHVQYLCRRYVQKTGLPVQKAQHQPGQASRSIFRRSRHPHRRRSPSIEIRSLRPSAMGGQHQARQSSGGSTPACRPAPPARTRAVRSRLSQVLCGCIDSPRGKIRNTITTARGACVWRRPPRTRGQRSAGQLLRGWRRMRRHVSRPAALAHPAGLQRGQRVGVMGSKTLKKL